MLEDDLTVVRRNLEAKQLYEVPTEQIRKQWKLIYREHFLERLAQSSKDCASLYQNYKQGFTDEGFLDCQAVVFFYRLNKMLGLTGNALRQQITNTEQRRLEKEIKELLDDWSQDSEVKRHLLTGRQVELAEELSELLRSIRAFVQCSIPFYSLTLLKTKYGTYKSDSRSSLSSSTRRNPSLGGRAVYAFTGIVSLLPLMLCVELVR